MNQLVTGKFIALKRKQKNLTQEQLAEKLGVSNKTISKWETGKCMPDYSIVKSLCEELEVTVAELMDGEISEENSVRTYDDEQILDLLRRTQELEKQKNMLYGIMKNCRKYGRSSQLHRRTLRAGTSGRLSLTSTVQFRLSGLPCLYYSS